MAAQESFVGCIVINILEKIAAMATTLPVIDMQSDLTKIENELSKMKAFLLDAEDKKAQNRYLSDWLFDLRDTIHDVDDVVDDVIYEDLKDKIVKKEAATSKVPFLFPSLNRIASRFKISFELREIRDELNEIVDAMSKFYLQKRVEDTYVMNMRDITSSSDVIGREADKIKIIELLMREEDVSVISIVGMGGLGKTTLAKLVYNDDKLKEHFQMKTWMCASTDFDISKLMEEIIKSASNDVLSACTDHDLKIRSRNILDGKRFLLVLDDMWNEAQDIWVELRNFLLLNGSTGSKILITTRSKLVGSIAGSICTYMLPGLTEEESMLLFVKLAFKEGQQKQYPDLMKIGNEIVRKCKGLPLALKTLGSLLYLNTNIHDWVSLRDNEMWNSLEFGSSILPALNLSYEKLPSYLKHCFAYFSLFPKGYEFTGIHLIQLWMAEGLIMSSNQAQELEEIGERYLKELWSRSFIQEVEVHDLYAGFKMHDLLHDLAVIVAQNECWSVNFQTKNIPNMVRHVSFWDSELSRDEVLSSLLDLNRPLRTIMFPIKGVGPSDSYFVDTCINRFKTLRVLDLKRSSFEALPSSVCRLKHLRLLTLSDNHDIKKLPKSLCKLHNLQTLQLFRCLKFEELPKGIENLTRLRFFYITTKQMSLEIGSLINLRFLSISYCRNLKSLDEKVMERLTSLRTLWIIDCESLVCLPSSLKHLTVLKINGCPELGKRCQPQGEDWHKIDHIREITVDSQKIQLLGN